MVSSALAKFALIRVSKSKGCRRIQSKLGFLEGTRMRDENIHFELGIAVDDVEVPVGHPSFNKPNL
jgi:hypothetical protein